jgi:hypothetical protein
MVDDQNNSNILYWREVYSGNLLNITYTLTEEEKAILRGSVGIDTKLE